MGCEAPCIIADLSEEIHATIFRELFCTEDTVRKMSLIIYTLQGEFLNVTNEMQLLKTLLLSLLYMFRALLSHYQELTKTVRAAYSDGIL